MKVVPMREAVRTVVDLKVYTRRLHPALDPFICWVQLLDRI